MDLIMQICVSLSSQKCTTQPALINLHPNVFQEFKDYSLEVKLDRCVGSCNTLTLTCLIKHVFQTKQKI